MIFCEIRAEKQKKLYHYLTAYGLMPWICLYLFYIMILFLYGWMNHYGLNTEANSVCEAVFGQFQWLPLVSEVFMVPPFLYWFYLQFTGKTAFQKAMAFTNILVIYGIMYAVKSLLPVSAFRLGFTNGLMSASMAVWFLILLLWTMKERRDERI